MLESWPISRRINSGFLFLTLMLMGLAMFSHRSVGTLGTGYLEYNDISRQSVAMSVLMEDVFEARLASFKYRLDPDEIHRQDVTDNLDEVVNDRALLQAFSMNRARQAEVQGFVDQAQQYKQQFNDMADLVMQALRFHTAFTAQSGMINDSVNTIFAAAVEGGNPALMSTAGRTLQASLNAALQSRQFLQSNDPADLAAFSTTYGVFETALGQLIALKPTGPIGAELDKLQDLVTGYPGVLQAYADANRAALRIEQEELDQIGPQIQDGLDLLAAAIVDQQSAIGEDGLATVHNLRLIIPTVGGLALLAAIFAAFVIGRWISHSVERLADATDRLAAGDTDLDIAGTEHDHELGRMSRALNVFRDSLIARTASSAERAKTRADLDTVVTTLQHELAQLADGNLTRKITQQFAPDYEQLRANFNDAVESLHQAVTRVMATSAMIESTTIDTNAATTALSQRTENQAATLEQTAAALDELTASVRSAAEHAKSVDSSVGKARAEAAKNGEIVAQAVRAMAEIENSSRQITQVISVIDDIAFQTNLLALNAGVEAARAGDSGKGFAVVASEVRALAQRSAEAAKEISELIANSSKHVKQGTVLVGNAGEALTEIITQVNEIAAMTSQIATSAQEQSIGLSEINIGVNQLDQATQQNAAMVQDSMTRGDALASEAGKLGALIGTFQVGTAARNTATDRDPDAALVAAISRTHVPTNPPPMRRARTHGTANGPAWEDF